MHKIETKDGSGEKEEASVNTSERERSKDDKKRKRGNGGPKAKFLNQEEIEPLLCDYLGT